MSTDSPTTDPARPPAEPLVRLRGVGMSYGEGHGERVVLAGAEATVGRGEIVALVGRSGSGKSTLLNLVSGIEQPTDGDVEVAGRSLTAMGDRERTVFRRDHVGFVFQFFHLIPTLTVEENLLLPLELQGRLGRPERARALALLAEVGLGDRAGAFPDVLSGGEQQRVAVARALGHDPLLVLADEPTGNLDLETGAGVLDLLERLTRGAGKTLLVATHSRRVAAIADRVLRVEGGRLVEEPRA